VFFEDSTTNGKTHSKWQSKVAGSRVFHINKDRKRHGGHDIPIYRQPHQIVASNATAGNCTLKKTLRKKRKPGRKTLI
jgi:hypothetical protein